MSKIKTVNTETRKVDGHSVDHWNTRWELAKGGFIDIDPSLYGVSGVWRALDGERVVAIGSSWATDNAALYGRLKTIVSGKVQTGNAHYLAMKIKDNAASLQLQVIRIGEGYGHQANTTHLSREMRRLFQPPWNAKNPKPDKTI